VRLVTELANQRQNRADPQNTPRRNKMQKWEYDLLVQSPNTECARCEEALNGLGRDGWELVIRFKKTERTISGRWYGNNKRI
jgi:ribosomal protein L34E